MNKLKRIAAIAYLVFGAIASCFAQNGSGVLKNDTVFAVYIKAGYLYDTITESLIKGLQSNDIKQQNETLRIIVSEKLFGVTNSTSPERAVQLIQEQKFIPTGNLAFSITSGLDGTALMDVMCNPESLPGYLQDFFEERGIETKLNGDELILSTPMTEQKGKLTASKLIIGNLPTKNDKPDKSWQVFENAVNASGTLIAVEADVAKIKEAVYKRAANSIREECEESRLELENVLNRYNKENAKKITSLTEDNIKILKYYSGNSSGENDENCPDNGVFEIKDGSISCSLHGTINNPTDYASVPKDHVFQTIDKLIGNVVRLRAIGNMNKLQAMICVNDEDNRKLLLAMLKSQIENMKNGVRDDERRPPERNDKEPPKLNDFRQRPQRNGERKEPPHKNGRMFGEKPGNMPPPLPPRHRRDTQNVSELASKIVIIDKAPWLGIEIPDLINMLTTNPGMLQTLSGPPKRR